MKIRILKAQRETFWYSDYIGQTFDVISAGIGNADYRVDTASTELYPAPFTYAFVEKEDAEVIA